MAAGPAPPVASTHDRTAATLGRSKARVAPTPTSSTSRRTPARSQAPRAVVVTAPSCATPARTPGRARGASAAAEGDAPCGEPRRRIDAVHVEAAGVHLEVQVRAGRLPAVADLGDLLAGGDDLADRDEVLVHVA